MGMEVAIIICHCAFMSVFIDRGQDAKSDDCVSDHFLLCVPLRRYLSQGLACCVLVPGAYERKQHPRAFPNFH